MSLFNWFRRRKHPAKKQQNAHVPAKTKSTKKSSKLKKRQKRTHNNDPKLTKKERLKIDSDGNVTVPAERSYKYTTNKIKHNGYNPHKDLKRRKFLFAKHIVYNPIEANTKQMRQIENLFAVNEQAAGDASYQVKGSYIEFKPKQNASVEPITSSSALSESKTAKAMHSLSTASSAISSKVSISSSSAISSSSHSSSSDSAAFSSDSAASNTQQSSSSSASVSSLSHSASSSSSTVSYSDDTPAILSMAGSSDVTVDDIVKKLKMDTKRQLSMEDSASDSRAAAKSAQKSAEQSVKSQSNVAKSYSQVSVSNSGSVKSAAKMDSNEFVIRPHSKSSNSQAVNSSVASSSSASSSSSSIDAYHWAERKVSAQAKALKSDVASVSSNTSISSSSSSIPSDSLDDTYSTSSSYSSSSSANYATKAEFQSALSSAKSSATSVANARNKRSQSQASLTYTQWLKASYTSQSKSNDRKLARDKARIDKRIDTYKRQERARQKRAHDEKVKKINTLNKSIVALKTSVAVLGGSRAKAKSASESRASSASVARSVNAKLSRNSASNSRAMSLSASEYSASADSYQKQINSYDLSIKNMNRKTEDLNDKLSSAKSKASNANASLSVIKKEKAKATKAARTHKALEIAYIKSYRDLMKDEVKKQRELHQNKRALADAKKKNRQLVVVSQNNTDVLKKVSKLNTNVQQARNQMNIYKGQVTKLRKAYLILKKKSNTSLVDAKKVKDVNKKLEIEQAKNRKIKAAMHKIYDDNVKGQKKNQKLQKTIIKMHQSSIHTIKQLRHNIRSEEKLRYNKKLVQITNHMVDKNSDILSNSHLDDDHLSDAERNSISDNDLNLGQSDKTDSQPDRQHIMVSGFHPTHHSFNKASQKSSDNYHKNLNDMDSPSSDSDFSSQATDIPSRSQEREHHKSHGFLGGLFHHHDYDDSPANYYQQNEVHSNQRIFLLRNVAQHSSRGLRTLKTGDKLYTTMLMPGPTGEDYKTNFLLRDGTSIPATKRTVKLID